MKRAFIVFASMFSVAQTIVLGLIAGCTQLTQAQAFNVIDNFGGAEGAEPYAGLTIDKTGTFYGTSWGGNGTVYKLVYKGNNWTATPLHTFGSGTDGAGVAARVILGTDGNLYGTTVGGGNDNCGFKIYGYGGCGTVYRVDKSGNETVIYRFKGGRDGAGPVSEVVFDSAGNLYGAASAGGAGNCNIGCGVIYRLTPSNGGWKQSVLYRFTGGHDGSAPASALTFDRSGNLFGTAAGGGTYFGGTVFELVPSGSHWIEKTLYTFQGDSDGWAPHAGMTIDRSGTLYGTTTSYGPYGAAGTAFQLKPSNGHWTFKLIYGFPWKQDSEGGPWGTLLMDRNGNLYGTTYEDGVFGYGSVFKLTHGTGAWTYTSLHDFTSGNDGWGSLSNLIVDAKGNLYGTTALGGSHGNGVIFKITP